MHTHPHTHYHIIFSTKNRRSCLCAERRSDLFRYLWGLLKNKRCHLYRAGGVDDHIHLLTSLHPKIALADLVKDLKVSSSKWIHDKSIFPKFDHWQEGYGAFTHSFSERECLIDYIKRQEPHHRRASFHDELIVLLEQAGLAYDEQYLL